MPTQNVSIKSTSVVETLPIELSVSYYPEKTSQLQNDADYIAKHQLVAGDNVWFTENSAGKLVINSADTTVGEQGPQGPSGPAPNHKWEGNTLFFELPYSGGWGMGQDTTGPQGVPGFDGKDGTTFIPVITQTNSNTIVVSWLSNNPEAILPSRATITLPEGPQGIQGPQGMPGPTDYSSISNKPSINGVTIVGNHTAEQLRLASASDLNSVIYDVDTLKILLDRLTDRVVALENK